VIAGRSEGINFTELRNMVYLDTPILGVYLQSKDKPRAKALMAVN